MHLLPVFRLGNVVVQKCEQRLVAPSAVGLEYPPMFKPAFPSGSFHKQNEEGK